MVIGCSRYIDSEDPDFQLPGEPPVPVALRITHLADALSLSWELTDTVANIYFKVYYLDPSGDDTTLWGATSSYSDTITGLNPGRNYAFMVSSVLSGNIEGGKSVPVLASAGVISVLINNDNRFTSSRNVTVSFIVPSTTSLLRLSEDSMFVGEPWRSFAASTSFELSFGDGMKYLYVRFRFSDGSESDTTMLVGDSIKLDTEARIDSLYFVPGGITLSRDSVIDFYLVTGEGEGEADVSFSGVASIDLDFDAGSSDTLSGRYVYKNSYTIPSNIEVIDGVVTGHFTDAAGNQAEFVTATTLLNISNPPTTVTLAATAVSSSVVRLNWSQAIDNDFAAYHIFRDTVVSVSDGSQAVTVISSRSTLLYNENNLDDSTLYYYRIYVYDNSGLSIGSNVDSAMTLINQPPVAVVPAVRIQVVDADTTIFLSWSASSDADFESYRIFWTDGVDTTRVNIINNSNTTSFTDNFPSPGVNSYRVDVYDVQGKYAESGWVSVTLP